MNYKPQISALTTARARRRTPRPARNSLSRPSLGTDNFYGGLLEARRGW